MWSRVYTTRRGCPQTKNFESLFIQTQEKKLDNRVKMSLATVTKHLLKG